MLQKVSSGSKIVSLKRGAENVSILESDKAGSGGAQPLSDWSLQTSPAAHSLAGL